MVRVRSLGEPLDEPSGSPPDDEALVLAAQRDHTRFSELVDAYERQLHSHCFAKLRSWHDAEDVTQRVMLKVWQALPGFRFDRGHPRFRALLFKIAHNECIDELRKRTNRVTVPLSDTEGLTSCDAQPEDIAVATTHREWMLCLIDALSPDQRDVMLLRAIQLTTIEIASVLDKEANTVDQVTLRARLTLQGLARAQEGGQNG